MLANTTFVAVTYKSFSIINVEKHEATAPGEASTLTLSIAQPNTIIQVPRANRLHHWSYIQIWSIHVPIYKIKEK